MPKLRKNKFWRNLQNYPAVLENSPKLVLSQLWHCSSEFWRILQNFPRVLGNSPKLLHSFGDFSKTCFSLGLGIVPKSFGEFSKTFCFLLFSVYFSKFQKPFKRFGEFSKTLGKSSIFEKKSNKMEKKKFWRKSPKLSRSFGEFSKTF